MAKRKRTTKKKLPPGYRVTKQGDEYVVVSTKPGKHAAFWADTREEAVQLAHELAARSNPEVTPGVVLELREARSGRVLMRTQIAVEVVGPLIIHPSVRTPEEIKAAAAGEPTSFAVSHAPTGLLVATLPDYVTAVWTARQLVENSPDIGAAFAQDPAVVTFAGLPQFADDYLVYVQIEAQEPNVDPAKDLLAYDAWLAANRDELMLAANPMQPKGKAALYAALGSLVGTLGGLAVGFLVGGVLGGAVGAVVGGGEGAAGGAMIGGVLGMPVGATVGTIYGSVRGTDYVYPGEPGRQARLAAGIGGFLWPVVGSAVGAAVFAPDDQYAANPQTDIDYATARARVDKGDREAALMWLEKVGSWPSSDPEIARLTRDAEALLGFASNPPPHSLYRYGVGRDGSQWVVYDLWSGRTVLRMAMRSEADAWANKLNYRQVEVYDLPRHAPQYVTQGERFVNARGVRR